MSINLPADEKLFRSIYIYIYIKVLFDLCSSILWKIRGLKLWGYY